MHTRELFDLSGKVALVTGGGRGIGKAIAEALAEAGARVVISGRREEWLAPTLAELTGRGLSCASVVADVTQPDDAERTVRTALDAFGSLDILVNNAGQSWGQPTEEMPLARWRQVIDVNLTGVFLMSQLAGRHMIERGRGGRIINIASIAGLRGGDPAVMTAIAYNTSKGGIISFTRTLAVEWGRHGILVNAVAPGWVPTRMSSEVIEANRARIEAQTPLGRVGDLQDLKGVAVFLASAASAYITGQTIAVDGGISL